MHHVAIMNPSWRLIPKILSGEKKIESRWYQTRRAPWNCIAAGDTVWFKDSAKPVTTKATVSEVMQFTFADVDEARAVVEKYADEIRIVNRDPRTWSRPPKYSVLVRLTDPQTVAPFAIDKTGFGNANAWLTMPDIATIRL